MPALVSILNDFAHLFFPQVCAGCGTDMVNRQAPLCLHCLSRLPFTNFHQYAGNPVEKYFWGRIPLAAATAFCPFTAKSLVQQLLHQLKYNGNRELGLFLGRLMGNALQNAPRFSDVDMLVPLPLFAARQRKRGYNQSGLLCSGMASVLQLPVMAGAVKRSSATATQTHKNRVERWMNMTGRFELADAEAVACRHVLLVDDVITTGATLEACSQALLQAQRIKLSIATLAYTV